MSRFVRPVVSAMLAKISVLDGGLVVAFAIVLNPPDIKVQKRDLETVQRTSVRALRRCKLKGAGTLVQAGKCRICREKWQFSLWTPPRRRSPTPVYAGFSGLSAPRLAAALASLSTH